MVVVGCCATSTSMSRRIASEAWREQSLTLPCKCSSLSNTQCGPPSKRCARFLRSAMAGKKSIAAWQPPQVVARFGGNGAVCGSSPTPVLAAPYQPGCTINGKPAAVQLVQPDPNLGQGNLALQYPGGMSGGNSGFEIDVHQWWRNICEQGNKVRGKQGRMVTCSAIGIRCECGLPVTSC